MGFKRPLYSLTVHLLLLAVACVLATWGTLEEKWAMVPCMLVVIVLILIRIRKLYSLNTQKIAFMFDAINNNDYAFKYATEGHSMEDKLVSDSLNRITQILFQAKAEAVQREKYYELIMNSVKTGIIVIDDAGNIYQCNQGALRLLGISIFTHVKQLGKIDERLESLISTIRPGDKEQISFSNERGKINLSLRVSEMQLKERHVRIIALNDIHNEMDEKEIDSWIRLTRVLTHEIMNSITPITSLSDTLLSLHEQMDEDVRDGLEVISSTGKGLISFVESYRKFTHIPTPKPSLFYVNHFAERMVQLARFHNPCPNIDIRTDIRPDDLILHADENLISQVVLNLLKNAVQAIGTEQADAWILFKAYSNEEENVVIEISNNGPLIPPEEAEHIFVPFFTTKEKGSGIGLSISRQIMRLSGGSLELKSTPSTQYTTFILTFV